MRSRLSGGEANAGPTSPAVNRPPVPPDDPRVSCNIACVASTKPMSCNACPAPAELEDALESRTIMTLSVVCEVAGTVANSGLRCRRSVLGHRPAATAIAAHACAMVGGHARTLAQPHHKRRGWKDTISVGPSGRAPRSEARCGFDRIVFAHADRSHALKRHRQGSTTLRGTVGGARCVPCPAFPRHHGHAP